MTKAETKIRYLVLIEISSSGSCTKSDQELALEADTTIPYVQTILRQMALSREIHMASSESGRHITYPKKSAGKLF